MQVDIQFVLALLGSKEVQIAQMQQVIESLQQQVKAMREKEAAQNGPASEKVET